MATAHGSSPPHRPDIKPRESGEGEVRGGGFPRDGEEFRKNTSAAEYSQLCY